LRERAATKRGAEIFVKSCHAHFLAGGQRFVNTSQSKRKQRKPFLVVAALSPMLRGQAGRNLGDNDDTTRHLSGLSFRVLAFSLALLPLASRMIRLRNAFGGTGDTGTTCGEGSSSAAATNVEEF
jgi:hypothetical protein